MNKGTATDSGSQGTPKPGRRPNVRIPRPPLRRGIALPGVPPPVHRRIAAGLLPHRIQDFSSPSNRWMAIGLACVGLLVMAGVIVDLVVLPHHPPRSSSPDVATEIQRLRAGLNGPRYTETNGLFSIVVPPGWRLSHGDDAAPNGIVLRSPNGISVTLTAVRVAYNDLPSLYAEIRNRERDWGVHVEPEAVYFEGHPAVRREVPLGQSRLIVIDFVAGRVAHHLACEIPTPLVEAYRGALMDLLDTYRPAN